MTARDQPHLLVVGAGAKAVSLACHVAALKLAGCPVVPRLTIAEKTDEVGSLWGSYGGYSDGESLIYTSPLRDLGHPYEPFRPQDPDATDTEVETPLVEQRWFESEAEARKHAKYQDDIRGYDSSLFPQVSEFLHREFSITAWLKRNQGSLKNRYKNWVDAGSPNLNHFEFQQYLKESLERAQRLTGSFEHKDAPLIHLQTNCEVGSLYQDPASSKWMACFGQSTNQPSENSVFDGVIVTGVGEPRIQPRLKPVGNKPPWFNVKDFWRKNWERGFSQKLEDITNGLESNTLRYDDETKPRMLIIGGGGAGVAVAERLQHFRSRLDILIVGSKPTLAPRTPSRFHDHVYGSNTKWSELTKAGRGEVLDSDTGAAWAMSQGRIECIDAVDYIPGYVTEIIPDQERPYRWQARISSEKKRKPPHPDGEVGRFTFDIVVDARGLDYQRHVKRLLDKRMRKDFSEAWENATSLRPSLTLTEGPKCLHVPNDRGASLINPAASNLMALGWLSTSMLEPYVYGFDP